jgi:hypothetical protein
MRRAKGRNIRGRKSSGGRGNTNYVPVTNNIVLWVDASDKSSIQETAGKVSQWADKSGQGNHLTQTEADDQPTTNATTHNSFNVIDFSTDTRLQGLHDTLIDLPEGAYTIYAVAKRNAELSSTEAVIATEDGSNIVRMSVNFATATGRVNTLQPGQALQNNGNTNTNFQIIEFQFNGVNDALSTVDDGTPVTGSVAAVDSTSVTFAVGSRPAGSQQLKGSIAEIIIYRRDISTAERDMVKLYLSNKWAITI